MTKLSPATQAVLDAVNKVYWDWSNMQPASSDTITAAALRAVVDQLARSDDYGQEFINALYIRDIADELEGSDD